MDYNSIKERVIEQIKFDSTYFPFEWIREYKHLLSMQEQMPIPENVKEEYFAIFKISKEQCENLLKTNPSHEDADLWKEAIDEIGKIL